MYNAENLQEKWAPVLNHEGLNDIKDPYRKSVTAILLENQERALAEERAVLTEAPTNVGPINTPTTGSGAVAQAILGGEDLIGNGGARYRIKRIEYQTILRS